MHLGMHLGMPCTWEWSSSRSYVQRVNNLSTALLKASDPGTTVFDDNDVDRLTGSSGRDWFFANIMLDANNGDAATKKDKIEDANANEFGYDIDLGG